jgi:hypothetical protein
MDWRPSLSLSTISTLGMCRIGETGPAPSHQPPDSATACPSHSTSVSAVTVERPRRDAGRQGPHQQPLRVMEQRNCQPCGPPPPVAMDAGRGAPAGRSIGVYSYHPGIPRTASGQASQAFSCNRDFCRCALLAAITRKQSPKCWDT